MPAQFLLKQRGFAYGWLVFALPYYPAGGTTPNGQEYVGVNPLLPGSNNKCRILSRAAS